MKSYDVKYKCISCGEVWESLSSLKPQNPDREIEIECAICAEDRYIFRALDAVANVKS